MHFGCIFLLFWSYRKAQFSTSESTKIRYCDSKISKILWRVGTAPSPDPSLCGEGDTPSPHPTPFGASIRLAHSVLGTALFSIPNCKMLATALDQSYMIQLANRGITLTDADPDHCQNLIMFNFGQVQLFLKISSKCTQNVCVILLTNEIIRQIDK